MESTSFGPYRLEVLLGRGGMGEVWRAHDTVTKRTVAIKVLPPHLADDDTFVHRFRREAEAAARLNNPHVIPIHTYGEIEGRLFVDMRLIEGRDLQSVLADGPLEPARAVRIIEEVARALHAAHKVGLVHRDVKPSNILLDEDDFAYLIDFGIARSAEQTGLTSTGAMIGTWHYMAPERMGAGEVDARADIYALACVLHECLTGSRPFPGESMESQVAAHLQSPPPRPSATNPDVPAPLDAVIATGMAKKPEHRYSTTVELARAAREAVTVPIPIPRPAAQPPAPAWPTEPAPQRVTAPTVRAAPPPQPLPDTVTSAPPQPHAFDAVPTQRQEPLPYPPPSQAPPSARRGSRRKALIISMAVIIFVIAVAAAVSIVVIRNGDTARRDTAQTTLPFTGLSRPYGVAVDNTDTVYVTDLDNYRVLALPKGSTTQDELPFVGLRNPYGVAVDSAGTVYVADLLNKRVVALPKGSTTQEELPFTGLQSPHGAAVDSAGTVYVTDTTFVAGAFNNRVVALEKGATTQTELPFTGLNYTLGAAMAVDSAGTVYVTDHDNNRVVALAKGATTQTEVPFTGLDSPTGVAVDGSDTVYVADHLNMRVVALEKGSSTQTEVPIADYLFPDAIAVDSTGTVYVTDTSGDQVVALRPQ